MSDAESAWPAPAARDMRDVDVLLALGDRYIAQRHLFAAKGALRRAAEIAPHRFAAQSAFGRIALECGDASAAVAAFERCMHLVPGCAETALALAGAYRIARRPADALRSASLAMRIAPHWSMAHAAVGDALLMDAAAGRNEDSAEAAYAAALRCNPADARANNGVGELHRRRGEWKPARVAYDRTLTVRPHDAEARYRRALLDLREGDYARGYAHYSAVMERLEDRAIFYYRLAGVPLWSAQPLRGARLVVSYESGLGDHLMMARFFAALARHDGEVTVETPSELAALFGRTFPDLRFRVARHWKGPGTMDLHVPLMQLPAALGVGSPLDVRSARPYLRADPARIASMRERLALGPGAAHVGIVWHGDRRNHRDAERSTDLADWAALASVENVHFHSLQMDATAEDIARASFALHATHRHIADIEDTAAIMTLLNLVISVDTAMVHLAGALGRPVWMPNAFAGDWRWRVDGGTSPWYETLRQFRQPERAAWEPVFRNIAAALRGLTIT